MISRIKLAILGAATVAQFYISSFLFHVAYSSIWWVDAFTNLKPWWMQPTTFVAIFMLIAAVWMLVIEFVGLMLRRKS